MKLAKVMLVDQSKTLAVLEEDGARLLDLTQVDDINCLTDILHAKDPLGLTKFLIDTSAAVVPANEFELLAPIDQQEVWAAGVTYKRSQQARMEESEQAASHYDQVYTADRPELFFKATPNRVSGPDGPVRVREDSSWSVPEPELTLVLTPTGKIVGYTIGNDMSARDIEGENPLYLPQAKLYHQCAAIGPCIYLGDALPNGSDTKIELTIKRDKEVAFQGDTQVNQLNRKLPDLADWLLRENTFPHGVFLMTGTGIVPDDDFTLKADDMVSIHIEGIGTLTNLVVCG